MGAVLKEVIKAIKAIKEEPLIRKAESVSSEPTRLSPFGLRLRFSSCVESRLLDSFTEFVTGVVRAMGLRIASGPAALSPQMTRWTVLSSPFVHKTARTQFERRTHGRALEVEGINSRALQERLVWYLKRNAPRDVQLEMEAVERDSIERVAAGLHVPSPVTSGDSK